MPRDGDREPEATGTRRQNRRENVTATSNVVDGRERVRRGRWDPGVREKLRRHGRLHVDFAGDTHARRHREAPRVYRTLSAAAG